MSNLRGIKKLKNALVKFSDFWKNPQDEDLSKVKILSRPKRELKGGWASNEKLLKGIYTGSNHEFALSSYLASGMVDIPRNLTGVPGIVLDKGQEERLVKEIIPLLIDEFPVLVTTMLVTGTAWRWARWSDELHRLTWEAIPDSTISAIIIELSTGEIKEIYTEEELEYNKNENKTVTSTRKRHITKELITEDWTGDVNKSVQYRNTFGFLPIPFGHDCYEGEWRGNSVFSRVLRWLKSIHDIAYKRDSILTEYEPKIVQRVKNISSWLHNNGYKKGEDSEFDPFGRKFFANGLDETTEFLFLSSNATEQHTQAIKDNELKVIKGSGIPELFFGALATGNHASTETDRLLALEHVKGLRRELTKGTQQLVEQSLRILAFMRFTQPPRVSIQWGNLSLLSEEQKGAIMGEYASAIVNLLGNGAVSQEGAFYFTKELYPEFPAEDPKDYMEGLNKMIVDHTSKLGQPTFEEGDV